ncbi:MAG: HAMP domain-containing sensor histidine kinase [Clostridia bacterium]|nr:HAMP domain-containing sensor histidine kinase [Clostridia bacterium]
MIKKLRRRLTLLVIGVLVLVTAGIVLSIGLINRHNIDAAATAALQVLADNGGRRPGQDIPETLPQPGNVAPPEEDGDAADGRRPQSTPQGGFAQRRSFGRRGAFELSGGDSLASLSNAYTVQLDAEGAVTEWSSDRSNLYTDAQVQALADAALAEGRESGCVDTQYYRLTGDGDARQLIVLDARLEFLSARRMLRVSALVASLACLLLSAGAYLLIRRMLRPVQDSFDRQKQFVWDASHEFKTPLAVISANAEVLSREIGPNEYLGYIQSEVKRTDSLVQGLLTLARMDRGTVTAQLKRMNLSEALLGVALPFESTVFEAGKTLETDIPEGVWCKGDEAMLQQLAVILLSNALKYSREGGLIRLTLAQKGRSAVITVYNTGEGIAPENLERIFDRFYRQDASHNREIAGNGLGLAIARTIAEAHRGHIRAESVPGESATFTVTLPL